MAILGQFRAGKGGRAQFDGTNILMMEYTVKWRTDKLDSSCFENANYEQGLTGLNGLTSASRATGTRRRPTTTRQESFRRTHSRT